MEVAACVKPQEQGSHVLTVVLQLAHEIEQEDLRMTAVRICACHSGCRPSLTTLRCQAVLLNDLAELLGTDLVHQVRAAARVLAAGAWRARATNRQCTVCDPRAHQPIGRPRVSRPQDCGSEL